MSTDPTKEKKTVSFSWLGIGTVLAAIGASLCCVGPLLLISLGIGGAWIGSLSSMEAVRPFFMILTVFFIWLGFDKLYLTESRCEEGDACASPEVLRRQRLLFWIGSLLVLLLLAFPWYGPYFL
jgi:mercuric ion transport protein